MSNAIVTYGNSNQQPLIFNFNGHAFRAFVENDEPVFIGNDVCEVLDLGNPRQALSRLDDDEKDVRTVDTPGGSQTVTVISESGLYSLILTSRKTEAKAFKRWITHEVLPSLRKTGKYELTKPASQLQVLEQMMAVFSEQQRQLEAIDRKQAEQAMQIESITDRLDDADYYTVKAWCLKQRIDVTRTVRVKWGKECTELSRTREIERKEVIEDGYPVGRYHKSILADVCRPRPKTDANQPYLLPKGDA